MNLSNIEKVILSPELKSGLNKYLWIQNNLHSTDVSQDLNFQRQYNGFYRVRQRKPVFYQTYYNFMEEHKNTNASFEETLHCIFLSVGRLEASFASKLVATIDTSKPVWDSVVLKNIGLKPPYSSCANREEKIIKVYHDLENWYSEFIDSNDARQIIDCFDKYYPNEYISDIKKIDLYMWQKRDF